MPRSTRFLTAVALLLFFWFCTCTPLCVVAVVRVIMRLQYRMHPLLLTFANELWYHGRREIRTAKGVAEQRRVPDAVRRAQGPGRWPSEARTESRQSLWTCFHVSAQAERHATSKSLLNEAQAFTVVKLVREYSQSGVERRVAVITPYKAQVGCITELLQKADLLSPMVEVSELKRADDDDSSKGTDAPRTVDSFQGLEADFVILSTVHAPPPRVTTVPAADAPQREEEKRWPFSLRNGRLCVAVTRAKMQFNWVANFTDIRMHPKLDNAFTNMGVEPVEVLFPEPLGEPSFKYPVATELTVDLD